MSSLQEINLRFLLDDYRSDSVRRAMRLLNKRRQDRAYLGRLLRDHRKAPIDTGREVMQREDIDHLIMFYSLLEVACICRFVPDPLPPKIHTECLGFLAVEEVKRFYSQLYPQLLPVNFLLRLEGELKIAEEDSPDIANKFLVFLQFTNQLEGDDDVDWLWAFLDDIKDGGYTWTDVRNVVEDPVRITETLITPPEESDLLTSAVRGYHKFIVFCFDFYEYLEDCKVFPLLQSAAWHYYAYWLRHLKKKVGPALEVSLTAIEKLLPSLRIDEFQLASSGIRRQRTAVKHLFSSNYGIALKKMTRK
jgi:hypothetical protein